MYRYGNSFGAQPDLLSKLHALGWSGALDSYRQIKLELFSSTCSRFQLMVVPKVDYTQHTRIFSIVSRLIRGQFSTFLHNSFSSKIINCTETYFFTLVVIGTRGHNVYSTPHDKFMQFLSPLCEPFRLEFLHNRVVNFKSL